MLSFPFRRTVTVLAPPVLVIAEEATSRTSSLVPVVMLTSSQERSDVDTAYRLGVNSYVVKPVNFDEYQSALAKLANYWTRLNQPCIAISGDPA